MTVTRSQTLSSRIQTEHSTTSSKHFKPSKAMVSHRPTTRSQTLTSQSNKLSKKMKPERTTLPKRMHTRSNTKRYMKLCDTANTVRITRSAAKFMKDYSHHMGL